MVKIHDRLYSVHNWRTDYLNLETVREGHDVQPEAKELVEMTSLLNNEIMLLNNNLQINLHGEKGGLGSAHALSLLTHFRLGEDFNATTSNFRGNVQGLLMGKTHYGKTSCAYHCS